MTEHTLPTDTERQPHHRNRLREFIQQVLDVADIKINGNRPWDMQVHDENFYGRLINQQSLGLGEGYMDGSWDCERLDEFFYHLFRVDLESGSIKASKRGPWRQNSSNSKPHRASKPTKINSQEIYFQVGSAL